MIGGTHARAREAGFTPEQAAFITNATIEIKDECWEHFEKKLEGRKNEYWEWFLDICIKYVPPTVLIVIGFAIGVIYEPM